MSTRVLVVDDDPGMCEMLEARLAARGFAVTGCHSAVEAQRLAADGAFDCVVTDIQMRGLNGLDLTRRLLERRPRLPVIVITAFGNMDAAIMALRVGARDFLPKPFEIEHLVLSIERNVRVAELEEEVGRLRRVVADSERYQELVGQSAPMREMFGLLDRMSRSDAPAFLTGESGTGKELVARALHARGPRAGGPFVAINCAAMPEQLLESELFGHTRGAFTDARADKKGLFVAADGGTVFLDEIGELPLALQPKLLRALQERSVRPVGGTAEVPFDARVITATNRDLEAMIEGGRFREDLFFRVAVLQVRLPPLRARGRDVLLLAQHFLDRIAARAEKRITRFSPEAAAKLLAYAWPGNVRELENCVERAVALANSDEVVVADLPERVRDYRPTHLVFSDEDPTSFVTLDELEKRYALRVLESVSGNKSAAARILGIERKTLYRMFERWGVTDDRSA
jgi:two-component system response regulator HydG